MIQKLLVELSIRSKVTQARKELLDALVVRLGAKQAEVVGKIAHFLQGQDILVLNASDDASDLVQHVTASQSATYIELLTDTKLPELSTDEVCVLIDEAKAFSAQLVAVTKEASEEAEAKFGVQTPPPPDGTSFESASASSAIH